VKSEGGFVIAGGAPLVADGKVIVSGNRPSGFIQALDAETGKYLWNWSALPKPGDPAYKTWGGATPDGAPIWVSGSYDPELGLLYYGTGQPNPQWTGQGREGDNLYSSWTRPSEASRASSCCRPTATGSTTCSIERTASFSSGRRSSTNWIGRKA
jgi:glucose dehydrogenase